MILNGSFKWRNANMVQQWTNTQCSPHPMIWKIWKTDTAPSGVTFLHPFACYMFLIPFFFFPVRPLVCRGLPRAQIPFLASASWAVLIRRLEWEPKEGGHPHAVLPTNVLQRHGPAELMDLRRRDPASYRYNRQVSFLPGCYRNAVSGYHKPQNVEGICPVLQAHSHHQLDQTERN